MTMREFHPVASIFPLMEGREFDELVADIKAHGQREPIWVVYKRPEDSGLFKCYGYDTSKCVIEAGDGVWHCRHCDHNPAPIEELIVDGRNRARACEVLGIEPWIEFYDGTDLLADFVWSLNGTRRHLTESQKQISAGRFAIERESEARLRQGSRTDLGANLPQGVDFGRSREKAAEAFNVSERTVTSAVKVVKEGAPQLISAVERGEVSVSAAATIAEKPKEEQAQIVAKGEKEILAAAKQIRAEKAEARRTERIEKLVEISRGNAPLIEDRKYPIIYADPPWRYGRRSGIRFPWPAPILLTDAASLGGIAVGQAGCTREPSGSPAIASVA